MNELEKLYKNAEVKKTNIFARCKDYSCTPYCENWGENGCTDKNKFIYPPFTAEKQLRILKCLTVNRGILIKQNVFFTNLENPENVIGTENIDSNFEEGFASLINILWQNLTQSERKQIREILNVF